MGEVYRARDTRLDRIVAIKILPQEMARDPLRKQRFEREAKTISGLNHPHICVLHDVGSQDGLSYLVMECLEGETLAKRLEKGPLPLEQALKFGAQIADALDKAHRRCASRSEARQHHADGEGSQAAGLWVGQAGGGVGNCSHADSNHAQLSGHRARDDCWDISIHVAGTSGRQRA